LYKFFLIGSLIRGCEERRDGRFEVRGEGGGTGVPWLSREVATDALGAYVWKRAGGRMIT
jgi:hypothetical protein